MDATMTDHDQERIDAILAFWFKEQALTAPQIDRRMDVWFGGDEVFDLECKMDKAALKLCVEGARDKKDKGLTPIEQAFFYMPLQHTESRKVQEKAVDIFNRLAEAVSPTYRETFETMAQFAELHRDIVEQFGRFPHRNVLLGRENTPEEDEYLAGDSPDFGQGS
jgi:uncharacterized protein (DUF924 family)